MKPKLTPQPNTQPKPKLELNPQQKPTNTEIESESITESESGIKSQTKNRIPKRNAFQTESGTEPETGTSKKQSRTEAPPSGTQPETGNETQKPKTATKIDIETYNRNLRLNRITSHADTARPPGPIGFARLDVVRLGGLAAAEHVVEPGEDVLRQVDALASLAHSAERDGTHAVEHVRVPVVESNLLVVVFFPQVSIICFVWFWFWFGFCGFRIFYITFFKCFFRFRFRFCFFLFRFLCVVFSVLCWAFYMFDVCSVFAAFCVSFFVAVFVLQAGGGGRDPT